MKFKTIILIYSLLQFNTAFANDIETLLFDLPNVSFTKIKTVEGFKATYKLKVKQRIDHTDDSKGYFYQQVILNHQGFEQPMIIITEGYSLPTIIATELSSLLKGNQLSVEHRYFGESIPSLYMTDKKETLNYAYLNLKQISADYHHINVLFKSIYQHKWLSSGRSKGGVTTLFYRYYYPDDVDASVQYVGPINRAFDEPRFESFFKTVGTQFCRDKLTSFQRYLLNNSDHILPLIKAYSLGAKAEFTYMTIEQAFEYSVMEFQFSFWQYGHNCDDIPDDSVTYFDAVKYLIKISDVTFLGDKSIKKYASHYIQSATELGYYSFNTHAFKDLIKYLPTDNSPHAAFVPKEVSVSFNGQLLREINAWLPKHGHKIIHIYGELDAWSASAVPPSEKVDSLWYVLKGKHHKNALIEEMTRKEKKKLVKTLERWLSIEID